MDDRDREFARLLRALASSRQQAELLNCKFLSDFIAMASIETVLQWDDLPDSMFHDKGRLEALITTKMKLALAEEDADIVAMRSHGQE